MAKKIRENNDELVQHYLKSADFRMGIYCGYLKKPEDIRGLFNSVSYLSDAEVDLINAGRFVSKELRPSVDSYWKKLGLLREIHRNLLEAKFDGNPLAA